MLTILPIGAFANAPKGDLYRALVVGEDTIIIVDLPEVTVVAERKFSSLRARKAYYLEKLYARDAKKYQREAIVLGARYSKIAETAMGIKSGKARKDYLKKEEEKLKVELESKLKSMSTEQADLFVKLVHKETGLTVFDILSSIKGKGSARYYNSLSRLKGVNLKQEFSPSKDTLITKYL